MLKATAHKGSGNNRKPKRQDTVADIIGALRQLGPNERITITGRVPRFGRAFRQDVTGAAGTVVYAGQAGMNP
jgi:hypothetical protein